jgi:predicted nucleic acid-binding protein
MILLDTNILLRLADASHRHHSVARKAIRILLRRPEKMVVVPQNLYEFWAVATRPIGKSPQRNGLGLTADHADFWLGYIQRTFSLSEDPPNLHILWRSLVHTLKITGTKSHDARLVAAMESHGIKRLLTFNPRDFRRFPKVVVLDPENV